ncbi:MAG: hypothetical protein ACTSO9_21075 [Candidatus Helarchaeota archaeon]
MGKKCNVCSAKPKIGINDGGKKFYFCDIFDEAHINYIKEFNLVPSLKTKLNSKIAIGIIFLILIQPILIFYVLGSGSRFTNQSYIHLIYFGLLVIAVIIIFHFGSYKYKLGKGLKLSESRVINVESNRPHEEDETTEEIIYCPNCGFESKKNDVYCGRCGLKLKD